MPNDSRKCERCDNPRVPYGSLYLVTDLMHAEKVCVPCLSDAEAGELNDTLGIDVRRNSHQ